MPLRRDPFDDLGGRPTQDYYTDPTQFSLQSAQMTNDWYAEHPDEFAKAQKAGNSPWWMPLIALSIPIGGGLLAGALSGGAGAAGAAGASSAAPSLAGIPTATGSTATGAINSAVGLGSTAAAGAHSMSPGTMMLAATILQGLFGAMGGDDSGTYKSFAGTSADPTQNLTAFLNAIKTLGGSIAEKASQPNVFNAGIMQKITPTTFGSQTVGNDWPTDRALGHPEMLTRPGLNGLEGMFGPAPSRAVRRDLPATPMMDENGEPNPDSIAAARRRKLVGGGGY